MNQQTSHKISSLIDNYQGFTQHEAFLWKKTAMSTIKLKIKVTKRTLTTLELRRLIRRRIPTNDVMQFVKKIQSKNYRKKMTMAMMQQKLRNAIYMEDLIRRQFSRCHEYMRRRWQHRRSLTSQFNIIMQQQTCFTWDTLRPRIMSKIENLAKKHLNIHRPPEIIEDILISDERLEQKYGQVEKTPLPVYGGIQLNCSMKPRPLC